MSQTFTELGLNPERMAGLEGLGMERPSKVQSAVIPQLLSRPRRSCLRRPPGSGRTAAYM